MRILFHVALTGSRWSMLTRCLRCQDLLRTSSRNGSVIKSLNWSKPQPQVQCSPLVLTQICSGFGFTSYGSVLQEFPLFWWTTQIRAIIQISHWNLKQLNYFPSIMDIRTSNKISKLSKFISDIIIVYKLVDMLNKSNIYKQMKTARNSLAHIFL